MPVIQVDLVRMQGLQESLNQICRRTVLTKNGVGAAAIDGSVAARRNIRSRLHRVNARMQELDARFTELQFFIKSAIVTYSQTENEIIRRAELQDGIMIAVKRLAGQPGGWKRSGPSPEQLAALTALGKMNMSAWQWYQNWQMRACQAPSAKDEGEYESYSLKVTWDIMKNNAEKLWEVIKNQGQAEIDSVVKSANSLKEIGQDLKTSYVARSEMYLDSPYDFMNHMTFGLLDGIKAGYEGAVERTSKRHESVYNYGNYLTIGLLGTIKGAAAPEDSYSKEHWQDMLGLAAIIAPGLKLSRTKGALPENNKNTETSGKSGSNEGMGKVDLTEPTLPPGGKPKGKYEKPDPNEPNPITFQNEAADLLASKGYDIEMLPNTKGGNGYGIKPTSNPDFLINGKAFDCYSPETLKVRNIWATVVKKTEEQASRIVMNLDGYKGSLDELYEQFKKYEIPTLDELIIIKDGQISRLKP